MAPSKDCWVEEGINLLCVREFSAALGISCGNAAEGIDLSSSRYISQSVSSASSVKKYSFLERVSFYFFSIRTE